MKKLKLKTLLLLVPVITICGCGTKYYDLDDYRLRNSVEIVISINETEFKINSLINYFIENRPYFWNFVSDSSFNGPKIKVTFYNKGQDLVKLPTKLISVDRKSDFKHETGIEILLKFNDKDIPIEKEISICRVKGVKEPYKKYDDDSFIELLPGDSVVLEDEYDLFLAYMNFSSFKPEVGKYQVSARYYNYLINTNDKRLKYGDTFSNKIEFVVR